jgi:hypothetical protein
VGLRSARGAGWRAGGGDAAWTGCDLAAVGFAADLAGVAFVAVGFDEDFDSVFFDPDLCASLFAACGLAVCALLAVLASGFLVSCDFDPAEDFDAAALEAVVFVAWDLVVVASGAACALIISASDPTVAINTFHRHADARANVITASFARIDPGLRPGKLSLIARTEHQMC